MDSCILIINWNNGADTVACIKSVISFSDSNIIVLDNASEDDSIAVIQQYLTGNNIDSSAIALSELPDAGRHKVLFVKSSDNLGFAKGNNALLSYLVKKNEYKYAWLLNNDAVADEMALQQLVTKAEQDTKVAFVGSVVLDYFKRDLVQSCGVKYYKYFGVSKLILKNADWLKVVKTDIPVQDIDFQHGASLFVRISALKDIGMMDERYFLYFEEQDWQFVARDKGHKNELATDSIIYHKGSVSTNSKKHLFFYYYNRSAILFSRKHYSSFTAFIASVMLLGITIIRTKLNLESMKWGIKGMTEAWKSSNT